ncbi:Poly rna polymerase cid13 [Colletotrichum higginsianum IMI 349063]|uniref:polynucleotide adenylyltransferase n=1 Tax=Colletotrichum higginsianum (strain IMI 349063) TaxID=759273 RepID=A0A1B7YKS3_COLHI|nr:Poly rna polymerase cid13 [Colletotrichum higginsianum IMI 349063]OBR12657.1 Poly rna polymerase cid13 [Colletotrichum higginsianum IMI 349063]
MQNSPARPSLGQSSGSHTNGLEDHLRNLILTNGTPGNGPAHFPDTPRTTAPIVGDGSMSGSDGFLSQDPAGVATSVNGKPPASPKVARKRPNQAQRRQMNAQLSIPIDPRPSPPTQHGRPFSASPNNPSHNPGFYPNRGRYQHHPGPHHGPHHGPGQVVGPYSHGQPHSPRQNGHHPSVHSDASRNHHDQHPNGRHDNGAPRYPRNTHGTLYSPRGQHHQVRPEELENQAAYLEGLCNTLVAGAEIERGEIAEKEAFRTKIEQVCRAAITEYEVTQNSLVNFPSPSVQLKCFGSLSSGFATKASDMDLGLVSPLSLPQPDAAGSPIPRLIEKAFLELGLGARLLTRTRVPIIKLCEKPPEKLLVDLLEEREKWEKGIVDNDHADAADEDENAEMEYLVKEGTGDPTDDLSGQKADRSLPTGSSNEPALPAIRQPENQSLSAYYNVAKRILRKMGGRDITLSNCRELVEEDYIMLNKVCEAFLKGLRDPELKRRLSDYLSLSFKPLPNGPNYRSLAGVFAQMEGERIVMLCESDSAIGSVEDAEESARMLIVSWKNLQNQPHFGIEPLAYTKQLQLHLEKLKKLPTAQLLTLEQNQHEAATGYHARTLKILSNLRPRNDSDAEAAKQFIIDKYTAGVWPSTVRAQVREFVDSTNGALSLVAVARRHKSLQLALELEKAVEHRLYDTSLESDIRKYISILRGPMRESIVHDPQYDYVVPVTKHNIETIKRMRGLRDPAKMAVNQPRDPYKDKLEFPKSGVGVQCDINFAAHLALHNTLLLRCYSHSDPRVRPLVLFIKHWAKVRGINTPYRGTLSSYGYVLMMLHYLVNVVQPFVCPNLQALGPPPPPEGMLPTGLDETIMCRGHFVGFWRDEAEILRLAQMNQLNGNRDSLGQLLRGFFEYYAQNGSMSTYPGRGYDWGRDVLSIRTPGGLLSKTDKGWTGAKTVIEYRPNAAVNSPSTDTPPPAPHMALKSSADPTATTEGATGHEVASPGLGKAATNSAATHKNGEVKEVRHRYLFAIEDPFELDHNVARTVTHNGIVAIRDEFRRAWRIIKAAGLGNFNEELLQDVAAVKEEGEKSTYLQLLDEIHGWELFE